jgi:hypothetical protein
VRARWHRFAKEGFWNDLEKHRKIKNHYTLLGEVNLAYKGRLTDQLLADVESLLILTEQPWGNIQSKQSRISRHGLVVQCSGTWPSRQEVYSDAD